MFLKDHRRSRFLSLVPRSPDQILLETFRMTSVELLMETLELDFRLGESPVWEHLVVHLKFSVSPPGGPQ